MARPVSEFGRVAVLYGGTSAEREVSLQSGQAVFDALQSVGVDATLVDTADGLSCLFENEFDRAFVMVHGRGGEDGSLQGALQLAGMPYTGCGVQGCAIGMDKLVTKMLWLADGLPTPEWVALSAAGDVKTAFDRVGPKAMVKPAHEGSSIGMSLVESVEALREALAVAAKYDRDVLVESYITGGEYTAAILGDQVLPLIRLETPHNFYDYEAKYLTDSTSYHCPSGLPPEREAQLSKLCAKAFKVAGAQGWGRVDFMIDESGSPWLLEVNTVPGMTSHSLVPMAAREAGIDFPELCIRILGTSMEPRA